MKIFDRSKKTSKPLGYEVLAAGESHLCRMPDASRFSRGAVIRCSECGRTASVVYHGMIGNYWEGPMQVNT